MNAQLDTPSISTASDVPDIEEIKREMQYAINGAFEFYERNEHALNVRYCWWEAQTRDGRKHGTLERQPFPWEGASDARIRTVDMVIEEHAALLLAALKNAKVQVTTPKAGDIDTGSRMSALLRWYINNSMADEIDAEIEPLANMMLTFGSAVLSIDWLQTLGYSQQTITLDDLAQMAAQAGGPQMAGKLQELIFAPAMRPAAMQFLQEQNPMLSEGDAGKILDDLQKRGEATFPKPYIDESRPSLLALQPFQDVFFPVNTTRLQKARWIAQREFLTEVELRARVKTDGWDEEWVEQVLLTEQGKMWNWNVYALEVLERMREIGGVWGEAMNQADKMYEVWHFRHRAQKDGFPAIFNTVFHPLVSKSTNSGPNYGKHEILPYLHGEYPYVEFVRERHVRTLLSSRGYPELLDTQQTEIKVQRDSRTDRASITTMPPIKVKLRRGGTKNSYGPGVEIPLEKMDDMEPMAFGAPDGTSMEIEEKARMDIDEYAGVAGEGIDPGRILAKQQKLVNTWMSRWKAAGRQMLALAQQYTPPMTIPRIVGQFAKPIDISREAIAGEFDLQMTFDQRLQNPEYVFDLLKGIQTFLLPMDTNATIDRDVLVKYGMAAIDPTLADLAVRDPQTAQQSEIEDEQANVAKMFAGQEPPMKLQGQNFGARLQVLQAAIKNPRIMALAQQWPDFGQMLERRGEFLRQQIAQQKNKTIGVYGVAPSAGSAGAPQVGEIAAGPAAPAR